MYNGAIKYLLAIAITAAGVTMSCTSQKSEEQKQAEALLSNAQSAFNDQKYNNAIAALDSLMKKYPGVLDVQRNAMHLRTLVIEQKTIIDSIANDSVIAANKHFVDSLSSQFKYVKTKDMVEGYYVAASVPDNNLTQRSGIEARIDDYGNVYLISCLYGKSVGHTYLRAKANGDEAETKQVAFDNAKNYRFKDGGKPVEMVTFNKEACDTICQFIANNVQSPITIEFVGKGKYAMPLSAQSKQAIANAYRYSIQKATLKKAEDLKIFYAQKLRITRKQSRQTATNLKGDDTK